MCHNKNAAGTSADRGEAGSDDDDDGDGSDDDAGDGVASCRGNVTDKSNGCRSNGAENDKEKAEEEDDDEEEEEELATVLLAGAAAAAVPAPPASSPVASVAAVVPSAPTAMREGDALPTFDPVVLPVAPRFASPAACIPR